MNLPDHMTDSEMQALLRAAPLDPNWPLMVEASWIIYMRDVHEAVENLDLDRLLGLQASRIP